MRQVTLALLLLFSLVASTAQTRTTFDRFKNVTHFSSAKTEAGRVTYDGGKDASILIHRMEMVVGFSCDGQVDACIPNEIELLFIAHTSDWEMKGNNVINLLIDDKPDTAGKADWDGQVLEAEDLVEYNDTNISSQLLRKLAEAKTVDVQIGAFEFSLTDANLASIKDIAGHAGWVPADIKKTLTGNIEASKSSPAAAAQLAQDGHTYAQQELAQLVHEGQASKTAIITIPAGAEIFLDGNKLGVTPTAFVLLKREVPRVIVIKLAGYRTIEKTLVPDGKNIPLSISLEREQ